MIDTGVVSRIAEDARTSSNALVKRCRSKEGNDSALFSSRSNDPPIALRLLATPLLNQIIFNLTAPQRPEKALQRLSFMGHTADTFAQLPASMADCYYFFQKLPHYRTASLSLLEQVRRSQGTAADMQPDVEKLKRITQPTMFLWGSNDTFNSVANSNKGAQLLPHAEFHTIAGGGHLAWLDNLTECSRLLQNFLADF